MQVLFLNMHAIADISEAEAANEKLVETLIILVTLEGVITWLHISLPSVIEGRVDDMGINEVPISG